MNKCCPRCGKYHKGLVEFCVKCFVAAFFVAQGLEPPNGTPDEKERKDD